MYRIIINQKLYYGDTPLLVKLELSLALLLILILFGRLLYFSFKPTRPLNKIAYGQEWLGDGTSNWYSIGSLMGWVTLLKEQQIAPASVEEMQKDIEQLEVIGIVFQSGLAS